MFRSLVTLVLSGCLVQPGFADDCSCTAYTTDAATDANCAKLKEYISCTFKADDGTPCTVPVADRTAIAAKKCTTEPPKETCKCEVDYYGKDLGDSTICAELKTLDGCLGQATEQTGCGTETLSELKAFATKTKLAKKCTVTPAPVLCTAHGFCLNGGTCPADGVHKDKTPCECPNEYEGPKCEKKKNAAVTHAPVLCTAHGFCLNGGTCPTDGDHKDKTPCECPNEYEGPKCEKKKNAAVTPAPVLCTAHGFCLNGGTCPADGVHKDKTPCECPNEYEGPKCEKKKNTGTMVSPKDGLILTTFISCLIMLFA